MDTCCLLVDVFASAVLFAGTEAILPALEAAHAILGAVQTARAADEVGVQRTIFNFSGAIEGCRRPLRVRTTRCRQSVISTRSFDSSTRRTPW
jgi:hypothetical protein